MLPSAIDYAELAFEPATRVKELSENLYICSIWYLFNISDIDRVSILISMTTLTCFRFSGLLTIRVAYKHLFKMTLNYTNVD